MCKAANCHMKHLILMIMVLVFALVLSGCGGTRAKSEDEIRLEIENHSLWQELHVQTTEFYVEKRQTNQDTKEDIVYVAMTGENDKYTAKQYFIATYNLYNEGWILDSLEKIYDNEHVNSVTPKVGVEQADVDELVNSISLWDYCSFEGSGSDGRSYGASIRGEPVATTQELSENYGLDVYSIQCTYFFSWFNEIVNLPLTFTFQYINPDVGYDWVGYVDVVNATRRVELNDGIVGEWSDKSWKSPFYASVSFSDRKATSCWCDFSSYTYALSMYITGKKDYSGWVTLDYQLDSDDGRIDDLCLVFDSDKGEFRNLSGDSLVMWNDYITAGRNLEFHKD